MQPSSIANSSSSAGNVLQRGIAAARAKRNAEARELLMLAVELDDHDEQAWLWLSSVVESLADRRVCLENVLAINPDNRAAQKGLRWLDEHAPVVREHCPHCNAVLPASGDICPACKQPVLIICPQCGDFTEVIKPQCIHCGHFSGDFRQRARYYVTLATDYISHGKLSNAQWAIDCAIASSPDDADLWQSIGRARTQLDRPEDAIAAYQQAMAIAPGQCGPYLDLIDLYQRDKRTSEAQGLRDQALRQFQDDHDRLIEFGQALMDHHAPPLEAARFFERAVELQPQNASTRLLLGALYLDQRDFAQAREHFTRAVELTQAKSAQGQQARQSLARAKAASQNHATTGRGEVVRQLAGPLLISIMAALANARLSPLGIGLSSWLALGISFFGAWIWASADEASPPTVRHRREGAFGLVLWLVGFGLIVARV